MEDICPISRKFVSAFESFESPSALPSLNYRKVGDLGTTIKIQAFPEILYTVPKKMISHLSRFSLGTFLLGLKSLTVDDEPGCGLNLVLEGGDLAGVVPCHVQGDRGVQEEGAVAGQGDRARREVLKKGLAKSKSKKKSVSFF